MPYDVVRPLKLESSARGGTQNDYGPKELDACQDALPTVAVLLQDITGSTVDQQVSVSRTGGQLALADASTTALLTDLVSRASGKPGSHNALLDVVHYLQDGPGDAYASGAVCNDNYSGLLLVSRAWYTDSTQTKSIVSMAWTYSGLQVQSTKLTLYARDGLSVVRTVTDAYTYAGALPTGRTRTWGTT